ncbi:1-aminocyclopropane-1-carboxylate deaminase/D-cysteine desulfhydrase [Sphingobacterium sp. SYP-B4668]|uniref:1-aminocyclopropane-1-carboxylate deaminase/D-cysteine desulfhydrase n=1 Tax=Sphingobacterium sp. SYP-B4668 TaxID=2996035 RepID=UPI0022DD4B76|nr:pyridoxal-phosphate dependent enzyme [Sphingobacterium sp. SYP-B4668]
MNTLSFEFHSPEQEINDTLFLEKGVRVFVKRDDMIHPFISGNKWRKLKYTLQRVRKENKSTLVTFGGAWSNHLLATACAGATFGFSTIGYVRGDEVHNPVLALCKLYGMELCFISRDDYRDKPSVFEKRFGLDSAAFFINEGGYSQEAAQGCAEIITELQQSYDDILCACGTGATLAGLQQGISNKTMDMQLHGVPVLKGGEFIRKEVQQLGITAQTIKLHTDYHFGGYAKTKPDLLGFIQSFVTQTGIMIEPTYTGKLFYAAYDLIRQDYFARDTKILLIHTGGLTGFLGMYEKF